MLPARLGPPGKQPTQKLVFLFLSMYDSQDYLHTLKIRICLPGFSGHGLKARLADIMLINIPSSQSGLGSMGCS